MASVKFNYLLILFVLPSLMYGGEISGKYKKERTISKSYSVSSTCVLDVNNRYGNVFVTTWDQNTTEIDVLIRVGGDNEKQVMARFNSIDVAFTATNLLVSAVTKIGNMYSRGNISMEINYTVKIPKKGLVKINNEYGSIKAGKIYGKADIKCQYGDINIEELHADNNSLKMEYCGNARINYMRSGYVDAQYSQFNCSKVNKLSLKGQYTGIYINDADDINYKSEYGDVNIRNAGRVVGKAEYTNTRYGRINELLNLTTSYGDVKVEAVNSTARNITLNSSYTGISIGLDDSYPFDFELHGEYTGINGLGGAKLTQKTEKDFKSYYKGYFRNSGVNKIYIKSEYGNINLNKK